MNGTTLEKEKVRDFALSLEADLVGFASIDDYQSPRSPDPRRILPEVRSLVVMGFKEIQGAIESNYPRVGMICRLGSQEITISAAFRLARFLEKETGTRAVPVPLSYPLEMSWETRGTIGDVSLRHAAVAAGLGTFGRHNLIISPELGTGVVFSAVLSALPFESDPVVEKALCDDCMLCVEACPARALDEEGKTDVMKCLRVSQPYGLHAVIKYFSEMLGKSREEQLKMIKDPMLWNLYQASFMGYTYECFKCVAVCPAGR